MQRNFLGGGVSQTKTMDIFKSITSGIASHPTGTEKKDPVKMTFYGMFLQMGGIYFNGLNMNTSNG